MNWNELREDEKRDVAEFFIQSGRSYGATFLKFIGIDRTASSERKIRQWARKITEPIAAKEVLETYMDYQAALSALRKEQSSDFVDVFIDDEKPVGIAFVADRHIGNPGTDHETMIAHNKLLSVTPGMYVMEGGDGVDNFIVPKLAHAGRGGLDPAAQYSVYATMLQELGDKLLCVSHGNHDLWTQTYGGVDMLAEIVKNTPAVCTAQGAEIHLTVGNVTYSIYRQHKARFNTYMNPLHACVRAWETCSVDADIVVVDHQHVPYIGEFLKHGKQHMGIRGGTYKVRDEWAKSGGYFGASIGVPIIYLWPDKRRMQRAPDMEDLAGSCEYLGWLRK